MRSTRGDQPHNGSGPDIDLDDVDAFAETAHQGQVRSSGEPYIEHVRAVAVILTDEFPEPVEDATLAIALLHDVLEDCQVHPTILLERYGREIQEGVTLLSWQLRALEIERPPRIYWSGIRSGPRAVRLVKAADRIHNLRDTIRNGDRRMAAKYLEETPRELLPILRDAGETWCVERIEELLAELGPQP